MRTYSKLLSDTDLSNVDLLIHAKVDVNNYLLNGANLNICNFPNMFQHSTCQHMF
jgi:hypothetical protein